MARRKEQPHEPDTEPAEPASAEPPEARAIVPQDPLSRYMAEVSRHPVLSREEEHALAVRFYETGDADAARRLVIANLRLVVKIAHEYHRSAFSLLDLVQEGNIGLMQAVRKYNPYRGVKLSSYAAWWIRAYILRYIMDNWKMVKIGTTEAQRKLFFNLRKEQEKLRQEGVDPAPRLLAARLDVSEAEVREMDQRLGHDEVSLDAPVGEEGTSSPMDSLASRAKAPDEQVADAEMQKLFKERLAQFAEGLEPKERWIFDHRLLAEDPLTLQQVGDQFGVSRERARQIEARLVKRLKEHMAKEFPDFKLLAKEPEE